MTNELESSAAETVNQLLAALSRGDYTAYRALLSESDQEIMTEDALRESIRMQEQQAGRLVSYAVEGVVLHEAAGHAAVHVRLDFEKIGTRTELYNVTRENDTWKLDFDLAELLEGGVD